jgi:hypothetical protein
MNGRAYLFMGVLVSTSLEFLTPMLVFSVGSKALFSPTMSLH